MVKLFHKKHWSKKKYSNILKNSKGELVISKCVQFYKKMKKYEKEGKTAKQIKNLKDLTPDERKLAAAMLLEGNKIAKAEMNEYMDDFEKENIKLVLLTSKNFFKLINYKLINYKDKTRHLLVTKDVLDAEKRIKKIKNIKLRKSLRNLIIIDEICRRLMSTSVPPSLIFMKPSLIFKEQHIEQKSKWTVELMETLSTGFYRSFYPYGYNPTSKKKQFSSDEEYLKLVDKICADINKDLLKDMKDLARLEGYVFFSYLSGVLGHIINSNSNPVLKIEWRPSDTKWDIGMGTSFHLKPAKKSKTFFSLLNPTYKSIFERESYSASFAVRVALKNLRDDRKERIDE